MTRYRFVMNFRDYVPSDLFHQAHLKSRGSQEDQMEPQIKNNEPKQEVRTTETIQTVRNMEPEQEVGRTGPVKSFPIVKIVYFILGVLEIFLGLRLILKLLGASAGNSFVPFIYNVTRIFVLPFSGIFSTAVTQGAETEAVFEPATIIAMLIYALLAWGIVKLIVILRNKNQPDT